MDIVLVAHESMLSIKFEISFSISNKEFFIFIFDVGEWSTLLLDEKKVK